MSTKKRTDLKSYFVKNAIPTEGNFADLIDSVLNQQDDGLVKNPGDPLKIEAVGGENGGLSVTGNVSIGTNSPASVLHIKSSTANSGLTIQTGNNSNDQGIAFQNSGEAYTWHMYRNDAGDNKANLIFAGGVDADITMLTPKVVFDKNGNVGIGTDSPKAKLEVTGTTKTTNLLVSGTATSTFDGGLSVTGNVSIGTNSPASVLHIKSSTANSGLTIQTGNNSNDQGIAFQNSGEAYTWHMYRNDAGDNKANLIFAGGVDADITMLTQKVVFDQNGNVGIGTTSPGTKLDVAGNFRIKNGDNYFSYDGRGDISLYRDDRGKDQDKKTIHTSSHARAMVHGSNDQLVINYSSDFSGGVKIDSNVNATGYLAAKAVHFSAYVAHNKLSGPNKPLPMTNTTHNVGNGWSTKTSKFTAPVAGIYIFTFGGFKIPANKTIDNIQLHWYLRVNERYINSGNSGEKSEKANITFYKNYVSCFRTVITRLKKDDKVYIEQVGTDRVDNYRSGLEGALLSAIA